MRTLYSQLLSILCMCIALPIFAQNPTRIVFLAGRPSHGYGSHEHLAGCRILADTIERGSAGKVKCDVYGGGWPEQDNVLDGAAAIVMYCDGGGGHPALNHLDKLSQLMEQGVGFACLHYAVEVPTERGGPEFLQWLGGYFETHWSVNPHWVAKYESLPQHAVTRGVKPFEANDEWYFHMRFQPDMKGVTPILSAVAPESTMTRPDGPHSGNPAVRKEVAQGIPQHTAWVFERPNGGRSFGFTGGHYHWNWGRQEILRLVCNAVLWTAKLEVPEDGLNLKQPSVERLEAKQDEPIPANFKREEIQKQFHLLSRPGDSDQGATIQPTSPSRLLASSKIITSATPGQSEALTADVKGVQKLFLVVNDAGNGYGCDWADWINPTLTAADAKPLDLTTIPWHSADTQWGSVHVGKNAGGNPLTVVGKIVPVGIGTHANSVIEFNLPTGYERFEVRCALDDGGTTQAGGANSSVQFQIYANALPPGGVQSNEPSHSPANAVAGLRIHDGLEATLAAAEPTLRSLTNLDVDHRGRVWVCEVVNYRGHNGKRPEGDRILMLEDENGDGQMDSSKVFYQGRDIDSAMGICVLGNRVIVSASPNVWIFTDENGDDVPDRQELLFSQTGQAQHDHSAHAFTFGPDGKLYWNFGNTGKSVHDAQGRIVTDLAGNRVEDTGKPYYGGMVFRCNLDGSQFEVLGHNFRNNYEVAVDAFGGLWQSDNDDDGNKGTRINYVMEYGNYGYLDELTGAGWKVPRTNLEATIPEQHWHLNDPGVVPTMLLTGAGSPCGIMVYEGHLLPEVFRNQVIHCDPGPNALRAYPVTTYGAGYTAQTENILQAGTDNWFRPVDVCAAPDGSLFAVDWYDPGVGGHQMGDLERGRLYRIAPPKIPYAVKKLDLSTPESAVDALTSPNQATRYLAWQAVQKFGDAAVSALNKLSRSADPRARARALWALGKMPSHAQAALTQASGDEEADVRCMSVRLARQSSKFDSVAKLVKDNSPAVRREMCVGLRYDKSESMPRLWAELASQYSNHDRWYLEALGIGADLRWAECFDAYVRLQSDLNKPVDLDIAWRARCSQALPYLQQALLEPDISQPQIWRLLRSIEYHPADQQAALMTNLLKQLQHQPAWNANQQLLVVEALMRLPAHADFVKLDRVQQAINQQLRSADPSLQLAILMTLPVADANNKLIALASRDDVDTLSLGAAEALIDRLDDQHWEDALSVAEGNRSANLATALAATRSSTPLLKRLIDRTELPSAVRTALAKGLTRNPNGCQKLLEMAAAGTLPAEAKLVVGSLLRHHKDNAIADRAAELFPAPKSKSQTPLPPLAELVKRSGDSVKGAEVYRTSGTCIKCHQLSAEGKNVGPNLSEIGSKLAKEALYVAILDPSAGISHNYETYTALTDDGQVLSGLLISQSDSEAVLRDSEGIDRTLKRDTLEEFKKSEKSLMPDNLLELMTTDDLINLVEFLQTLRKAS